MLKARGLKKEFGSRAVLRSVDLDVHPGEISVLVGPSGSGKTTLIRALSLLEEPDQGLIEIDDRRFEFPRTTRRPYERPWPELTVVFQQLFLWPHLTLKQNILLPVESSGRDGVGKQFDSLVKQFEMADFIDRHPNEVSLGQRQRAAILRALMLRPKYILLDEITSALDVEQVSTVLAHLQTLRDEGIGILLVTHLIGFARRAASRVFFMDDGEIIETGGPRVLTTPDNPRVRRFLSVIEAAH